MKERQPILEEFVCVEDGDIVENIKGMDPKKAAAETTIALNILRFLKQYKQLDSHLS